MPNIIVIIAKTASKNTLYPKNQLGASIILTILYHYSSVFAFIVYATSFLILL